MSTGPKKTWRSGTEHINKPEISKAWQSAEIDADRAGTFPLSSSCFFCFFSFLWLVLSRVRLAHHQQTEKLHEVPQHLKVGEKVISRSGDVKQPSKKATKKHPSVPRHLARVCCVVGCACVVSCRAIVLTR
jgi:hypothetical protein